MFHLPKNLQAAVRLLCFERLTISARLHAEVERLSLTAQDLHRDPHVLNRLRIALSDNSAELAKRAGTLAPAVLEALSAPAVQSAFRLAVDNEDAAGDVVAARIWRRKLDVAGHLRGDSEFAYASHDHATNEGKSSLHNTLNKSSKEDGLSYLQKQQLKYGRGRRGSTSHAGAWEELYPQAYTAPTAGSGYMVTSRSSQAPAAAAAVGCRSARSVATSRLHRFPDSAGRSKSQYAGSSTGVGYAVLHSQRQQQYGYADIHGPSDHQRNMERDSHTGFDIGYDQYADDYIDNGDADARSTRGSQLSSEAAAHAGQDRELDELQQLHHELSAKLALSPPPPPPPGPPPPSARSATTAPFVAVLSPFGSMELASPRMPAAKSEPAPHSFKSPLPATVSSMAVAASNSSAGSDLILQHPVPPQPTPAARDVLGLYAAFPHLSPRR